jgi:hypothetical protein
MPKQFFLALVFLACGPSIKTQTMVQLEPLPSDSSVAVFADSLPKCPYEQVGLIASQDMEKTLDAARKMGADGVIGTVAATKKPSGEYDEEYGKEPPLCGTPNCVAYNTVAIRFSDPSCRE